MSQLFSADERERYARHIMLREIGGAGQQRLKRAMVAIVGAGGLGAPAALYLAAAGVGRLRLIDDDAVALSNLQRQVLYRTEDVGAEKVVRAAAALQALNPHVAVDPCAERLTEANALALLDGADLVLDGCDSFPTRFAVNAACAEVGIVGALTGIIGSCMALEAIKEIAQAGDSLAGRLLIFDGLSGQCRIVRLPRDPACPVCGG
jgi:molybdopterin/thiamine biosynthesis adenylyltransferase